jgi:hypothetical protein
MREPGLFGRQFRSLRSGASSAGRGGGAGDRASSAQALDGQAWQPAEDVLFVLCWGFLLQALAVVHGLKHAGVIGGGGGRAGYAGRGAAADGGGRVGFADTWVRFRERFRGKAVIRPGGEGLKPGRPAAPFGNDQLSLDGAMEVILLQKVANLGNIGDRVKVKPGYGRNYLLPTGKATLATRRTSRFEARRAELEKKAADELTRGPRRARRSSRASRSP